MGKRGRSKDEAAAPEGPFNAALSRLRERLPEGWTPPAAEAPAQPEPRAPAAAPARAVVRLERKGRGGKEATVVERLGLAPEVLARWTDEAKRALGCGGAVEGEALVLQGDQRERARQWLLARGVRRVTVS